MPLRPAHAAELARLHHGNEPLIVLNAWDAGSAGVAERVGAPVNILYLAGVPSLGELAASGVRRVSLGTGWYRCALGAAEAAARAVIGEGKLERIWEVAGQGAGAGA